VKSTSASRGAVVVLVTAGSEEAASSIARALVGEQLAACVNIVSPIRSIYRWNDEVQSDTEHLMIIKTRANLVAKLAARVKELHSYEIPEVIALPIVAGAKSYLDWVVAATVEPPREALRSRGLPGKARRKK
jgi:periplasmic divalent cation tolerance protein